MWLVLALVAMLAWGVEDVLFKINAGKEGPLFSLKIVVCMLPLVALTFIAATVLSESGLPLWTLVSSNTMVTLAILVYIAVMFISYSGARYMEISIFTPVSNANHHRL